MEDISTKEDIVLLVNSFYDTVKKDNILGPVFDSAIGDDWSHHLPIMYAFWGMIAFGTQGYKGNPIQKHIQLDKAYPLREEHYKQWYSYWVQTVDQLFTGEKATLVKEKAQLMLQLIQTKVEASRTGKSIL